MLQFNLSRIFAARGIAKPFGYLRKAGFSVYSATKFQNTDGTRFDVKAIEKLCTILHCTPNDLLEWVPSKNDMLESNHPLLTLQRNDVILDISRKLNSVSLEKLKKIDKLINEIGEE